MLNALTIAPDKFYADQPGVYAAHPRRLLGRAFGARAERHRTMSRICCGRSRWRSSRRACSTAANNLRELQALITAALAAHAPQEVIDQLLQRYNQAMQRYHGGAGAESAQNGKQQQQADDPNAKTISRDDLQKMMKAIQQLAASGNREQAAQMLAVLQNMLENMQHRPKRVWQRPGRRSSRTASSTRRSSNMAT